MTELACHLEGFKGSKLVVLNTVESAAALAKYLKESGRDVLHLSSALTPDDRERTTNEIRRRLKPPSGSPEDWTLVATSCVECGLDFSFHYGFCELRLLPSHIQIAGRVRRECEDGFTDALLEVFTVVDDSFTADPSFNDATAVFKRMIATGELPESSVTQAVTRAFRNECKLSGSLSDDLRRAEKQRAFSSVAEQFRVIKDETITVIADQQLASRVRSGERISSRELQRGSVSLRAEICGRLRLGVEGLPCLTAEQYDGFLGYMKSLV